MTLLQRNLGGPADQSTAFPPHRVVGNIYYVGTNSLATYLIGTRDRLNYVGANQDLGAARSRRNAGQETSTKFW
jgi:metallo-beta-lactamase class B